MSFFANTLGIPILGTYATQIVSDTIILDNSSFGEMILCNGSISYSVQLPHAAGNSNKWIYFYISTDSNSLVSLFCQDGASLQGQASILYASGESCLIYCDGTNYWIQSQNLLTIQARYTLLNPPSEGGGIVKYDTIITDSFNIYDTSTGVCLPFYPGNYKITAAIKGVSNSSFQQLRIICDNSLMEEYYVDSNFPVSSSIGVSSLICCTVTLNGVSDSFTVEWTTSGGYRIGGNSASYFNVERINNYTII